MNTFTFTDDELNGEARYSASQYCSTKTIQDNLFSQLMEKKERILKQAINNHLAYWSFPDLKGRLRSEEFGGVLTVYYLDDKPILEMRKEEGYVSTKQYSTEYIAEIRFRYL
tara:strand:+ start:725 stop:1060 length:336 start_codon:yes stop_codon:yes gene_type:complete